MRLLIMSGILIVISVEFTIALLPPTARDALIYHLAYPKLYLQQGRFFEIPFAFYSYYPMNTELLFMVPLYFNKDVLAAFIHMTFGLMTAGLIYYYLKNKFDKIYALLGTLIFLSTPIVIRLSTIPYIDLALAFHSTCAVLTVLKWQERREAKWLIISAVFSGLAAGTKYNGLYIPLILTFMILHISQNSRPFKSSLIFILISTAVASPWYIKNFIFTGNPFAPLFFNILGGMNIPEQPTVQVFLKRNLLYGESWLDIILIPIRVFFHGIDNDMQYFDGKLNPILLIFLPFAFRRKEAALRYIGAFTVFYFLLVYFAVDMQVRFLLPVLPVLTILTVTGIRHLMETGKARVVVPVAVALLLSLNLAYLVGYFNQRDPVPYILGKMTKDEYLLKHLRDYEACNYINTNLPMNARILMVYTGDRGYYIDRDYYYNSYLSGQPIKEALEGAKNEEDVADNIRKAGFTHLLTDVRLFKEFMDNNMDGKEKELFLNFSERYLKALHSSQGYVVYKLL